MIAATMAATRRGYQVPNPRVTAASHATAPRMTSPGRPISRTDLRSERVVSRPGAARTPARGRPGRGFGGEGMQTHCNEAQSVTEWAAHAFGRLPRPGTPRDADWRLHLRPTHDRGTAPARLVDRRACARRQLPAPLA